MRNGAALVGLLEELLRRELDRLRGQVDVVLLVEHNHLQAAQEQKVGKPEDWRTLQEFSLHSCASE